MQFSCTLSLKFKECTCDGPLLNRSRGPLRGDALPSSPSRSEVSVEESSAMVTSVPPPFTPYISSTVIRNKWTAVIIQTKMADGLITDCRLLLSRFENLKSVRFETFCEVWREINFSLIHWCVVNSLASFIACFLAMISVAYNLLFSFSSVFPSI